MKAKIDEHGWLHIERAGTMKKQFCPYDISSDNPGRCGDFCPHFGEVERNRQEIICSTLNVATGKTTNEYRTLPDRLPLCHGTIITGEIADERVTVPVDRAGNGEGSES